MKSRANIKFLTMVGLLTFLIPISESLAIDDDILCISGNTVYEATELLKAVMKNLRHTNSDVEFSDLTIVRDTDASESLEEDKKSTAIIRMKIKVLTPAKFTACILVK